MLREIRLHGELGARFGEVVRLAVETPAEAIHALIVTRPGFRDALAAGEWVVLRGRESEGVAIADEAFGLRFGRVAEMHILPAPVGAKGGGGSKVLMGVAMIALAAVTYGAAAGYFGLATAGAMGSSVATVGAGAAGPVGVLSAAGWATTASSAVFAMGVSMTLAGVSMMLAPQPKGRTTTEQNPSFLFTGPVNTAGQGAVIPLIYGKVRVGSIVGASTLSSQEFSAPPAAQVTAKSGVGTFIEKSTRSPTT